LGNGLRRGKGPISARSRYCIIIDFDGMMLSRFFVNCKRPKMIQTPTPTPCFYKRGSRCNASFTIQRSIYWAKVDQSAQRYGVEPLSVGLRPARQKFCSTRSCYDGSLFVPVPNYKQSLRTIIADMSRTIMSVHKSLDLVCIKGVGDPNPMKDLPS
jgi:hypothetical protein